MTKKDLDQLTLESFNTHCFNAHLKLANIVTALQVMTNEMQDACQRAETRLREIEKRDDDNTITIHV